MTPADDRAREEHLLRKISEAQHHLEQARLALRYVVSFLPSCPTKDKILQADKLRMEAHDLLAESRSTLG